MNRLKDLLARLHHEESGAVVVLCFAALMILFMVALIVYDTGQITRDKLDAQVAADTAAFSQAAVKARSMNAIALGNVGKRTIVGIRNMYSGQYPAYMAWLSGRCSRCCCGWFCGCWGACVDCATNFGSLIPVLAGFERTMYLIGRIVGDKFTTQLSSIDAHQHKLRVFTPYWAASESILRGISNGVDFVGTYPMPDNRRYGPLPVRRDRAGLLSGAAMESCLTPMPFANPVSIGSSLEWNENFKVLKRNSTRFAFGIRGPRDVVRRRNSAAGCLSLASVPFLDRDMRYAPPFYLSARSNSGSDLLHRSNMVFTYRVNEDYSGKLRDNYNIVRNEYESAGFNIRPQGGVWSMSRAEIYHTTSDDPEVFQEGPHQFAMHHPGWIAKLRPIALSGEDIPTDMDDVWEEAGATFLTQASLFGRGGRHLLIDGQYMNRVMVGLTGRIGNREVIDGIGK